MKVSTTCSILQCRNIITIFEQRKWSLHSAGLFCFYFCFAVVAWIVSMVCFQQLASFNSFSWLLSSVLFLAFNSLFSYCIAQAVPMLCIIFFPPLHLFWYYASFPRLYFNSFSLIYYRNFFP